MSLNWNLSNVADHETLCWTCADANGEQHMKPVTELLIFATMAVGMRKITASNVPIFASRLTIYEALFGAFGSGRITVEDIANHVGLETNALDESDAKWRKRMMDNAWREAAGRTRRHMRELEERREAEKNAKAGRDAARVAAGC